MQPLRHGDGDERTGEFDESRPGPAGDLGECDLPALRAAGRGGGSDLADAGIRRQLRDHRDTSDPTQIMQCRGPAELPVLSTLARSYAVSDAWFASVPSQTWPNRAFAHAGTSNGRVDNGNPPDPLDWNVPTIFNVLESIGAAWCVYSDTALTPSLTRTMFPKLWDPRLDARFRGFDGFIEDCAHGALPAMVRRNELSRRSERSASAARRQRRRVVLARRLERREHLARMEPDAAPYHVR